MMGRKNAALALALCAGLLPLAPARSAPPAGQAAPFSGKAPAPADALPLPDIAPGKAPPPRWLHKSQNGTLVLHSASKGATVFVDGLEVGRIPLAPLKLAPGPHQLRLARPGYRAFSQRIVVAPAQKLAVSAELKAVRGVAEVGAQLPGARLLVDGKDVGAVPLHDLELEPGKRKLALVAPGASKVEQVLTVKAGGRYSIFAAAVPGLAAQASEPQPPLLALPLADAPAQRTAYLAAPPASAAEQAAANQPESVPEPDAPPLVTSTGELPPTARAPPVPVAALQPAPGKAPSASEPLTRRWWFWGGAAVVVTALVAGVVYALPAHYVERRDPSAACGGNCGIVINK